MSGVHAAGPTQKSSSYLKSTQWRGAEALAGGRVRRCKSRQTPYVVEVWVGIGTSWWGILLRRGKACSPRELSNPLSVSGISPPLHIVEWGGNHVPLLHTALATTPHAPHPRTLDAHAYAHLTHTLRYSAVGQGVERNRTFSSSRPGGGVGDNHRHWSSLPCTLLPRSSPYHSARA